MTTSQAHEQTRILVQAAAEVCEDKKGEDTRILELDPIDSGLSDFFLITSATNDRQAIAIADEIEFTPQAGIRRLRHLRRRPPQGRMDSARLRRLRGARLSRRRARAFYDIERLRKSARPLTPAEFDAELKAALAAKTRAARSKADWQGSSIKTRAPARPPRDEGLKIAAQKVPNQSPQARKGRRNKNQPAQSPCAAPKQTPGPKPSRESTEQSRLSRRYHFAKMPCRQKERDRRSGPFLLPLDALELQAQRELQHAGAVVQVSRRCHRVADLAEPRPISECPA